MKRRRGRGGLRGQCEDEGEEDGDQRRTWVLDGESPVTRKLTWRRKLPAAWPLRFSHSAGNQRARNRVDSELARGRKESGRNMNQAACGGGMAVSEMRCRLTRSRP